MALVQGKQTLQQDNTEVQLLHVVMEHPPVADIMEASVAAEQHIVRVVLVAEVVIVQAVVEVVTPAAAATDKNKQQVIVKTESLKGSVFFQNKVD